MALAFGSFKRFAPMKGGIRWGFVDITLDGSYPGGGWPITAANLGLSTLYVLVPPGPAEGTGVKGFPLRWDHATGKLLAFQTGAGGTVGLNEIDAADVNGEVIRCMYIGW